MTASVATSAYPTKIKRGDGGVGAGAQAHKTIGATTHQLEIFAKAPGVAGNSKTFGIILDAGSVSYSQVVTANSVLINSATSSGTATTTVAQAISALYLDPIFVANFQATVASGDGSGILVAGASAALSGGSDGAEVFATISEVRNITGPQRQAATIEVTNMDSPDQYREYITSFLDAGAVTFDMNFTNVATQQSVISDLESRVKRNFELIFTTAAGDVTYSFAGFVTKFDNNFQMAQQILANVEIKITGPVTVS